MTTKHHPHDADDEPSLAVIEAVAEAEGCDSTDLSPLFEVIDPEALDRLVEDGASVSFDYAGRHVNITETGEIVVN